MQETNDLEISFQDIALRLWARRGIVGALVLVAVLGSIAWALKVLSFDSAGNVVYYVDLKGIDRGRYPGGATFSPTDLRSPEVLRASLEALNIEDSSLDELETALLIEYGSPETYGIILKHRERLGAKGLSPAEIDARNADFTDELRRATGSSLRLALDPEVGDLGPARAARLLQEIPAQWSRIFTSRYRIFEAPTLQHSGLMIEAALTEPRVVVAAVATIDAIEQGLGSIVADNRLGFLVTSSGRSAGELLEQLRRFRTIRFRPLSQAVLRDADAVTSSYRQELELEMQYLTAQLASYDRMVKELEFSGGQVAAELSKTSDSSAVNQLQLSGDSISAIVGLAERATNAEFLREILLGRHEMAKALALAEIRLERLEGPGLFDLSEESAAAVGEELSSLVAEYEGLRAAALAKLRTEVGTLYSASAAPYRERPISLFAIAIRMAGAVAAALFLGVVVAFVLPGRQALSSMAAGG